MKRRAVLAGVTATGTAGLLSACGGGGSSAKPDAGMACVPGVDVPGADASSALDPADLGQSDNPEDASETLLLSPFGLAVSPDGRHLVAQQDWGRQHLGASETSGTTVWDTVSGSIIHRFDNGFQGAVAFHPSGEFFAAAGGTVIDILDVTGEHRWRLEGHARRDEPGFLTVIHALAFSADGSLRASLGTDRKVRIWTLTAHACTPERVLDVQDIGAESLAFSPDAATLAVCGPDGPVQRWNTSSWKRADDVDLDESSPRAVAYAPDGSLLVAGADAVQEVSPGGSAQRTAGASTDSTSMIAVAPDGSAAAITGFRGAVGILDRSSGDARTVEAVHGHISAVAWSPADGTLACLSSEDGPAIWDGGEEWRRLEQP